MQIIISKQQAQEIALLIRSKIADYISENYDKYLEYLEEEQSNNQSA